jgi:hypothetical protein
MKRCLLAVAGMMALYIGNAQQRSVESSGVPSAEQRIQDSVIGWWDNLRFDRYIKPTQDAVTLKKIAHVNNLVDWVKKTYTPVAGLGTYIRRVDAAGRFGVNFSAWNVSFDKLWVEANGRFKPIPEELDNFYIFANVVPGSYPIPFMNKPGQSYYFTWQPNGYSDQTKQDRAEMDPKIHPNAYKYLTWVNEWCTVFLTPGNKLPFTPVTQAELLQMAETSLAGELERARKEAEAQWPGNTKSINEAVAYKQNVIDKYKAKIQQLRQKHAATLQQQAVVRDMQPTMYSFETDPDIFQIDVSEKEHLHAYPVYKMEPDLQQRCRSDQPQWVAVYFPYATKKNGNKELEIFRAMSENLNYDYLYNYFFAPEKVKGVPYKPAQQQQLTARLDSFRNKYKLQAMEMVAKRSAMPANAVLFDDFSRSALGSKPAGWYFVDRDKKSTVTTVDGQAGKWLRLEYNNALTPTTIKALPNNFTIEYDIVTDQFTGRTGGTIYLTLNGTHKRADEVTASAEFFMEITSGLAEGARTNYNYRGLARMKLDTRPTNIGYNERGGEKNIAQQVFTDEARKVHVQLRKQGGTITVSLNGAVIASTTSFQTLYGKPCGDCVVPADVVFTQFSLENRTQDADVVNVYVGNIKITGE